jgi:hypothetical protein
MEDRTHFFHQRFVAAVPNTSFSDEQEISGYQVVIREVEECPAFDDFPGSLDSSEVGSVQLTVSTQPASTVRDTETRAFNITAFWRNS